MKTETENYTPLSAKGVRDSFCNAFCDGGNSKTCTKNCMMRLLSFRTTNDFKFSELLEVKK